MKPRMVLTGISAKFDASRKYQGWYKDKDSPDLWWHIQDGLAFQYRDERKEFLTQGAIQE
jgi:hypothetical protein